MLKTEMRNPRTTHIDKMSPLEIARIMNEENANCVRAVEAELPQIALAIETVTAGLLAGGRLFYVGAGTSGRLGIVDASECPPTFGVSPDTVIGIMAGGLPAMVNASENREDDPEASVAELKAYNLRKNDTVVGISAAGGAAYVRNAIEYARSLGCATVAITSNKGSPIDRAADISICPDTGPEVITGSTRLKAGTAQKLILNMLSTGAMIGCGHVYENLMINLKPTNTKLRGRVISIVRDITGLGEEAAIARLEQANWNIREAIK